MRLAGLNPHRREATRSGRGRGQRRPAGEEWTRLVKGPGGSAGGSPWSRPPDSGVANVTP